LSDYCTAPILTGAREIAMRRRHPRTGLIVVLYGFTIGGFTIGVVTQAACRPPAPISGGAIHERVTVTGCVTSLTRTVGTDGHQNGLSHGTRYVLTADSHASTSAFWLDALDSQTGSYVGSRVEVQGTVEGNRSVSIADSESRMRPARLQFQRDSGHLPELPVVKVESVRLITPQCAN
jgi:hypothetical protein